jgi:hypothetical protein
MRRINLDWRRLRRKSHIAAVLVLFALPAQAAVIAGGFSMSGGLAPGQDFSGPGTVDVNPQSMVVLPGTIAGDFSLYLSPFEIGTHQDVGYDPFVPIDDLWTVTGSLLPGEFAFDLDTLDIDFQSTTQLNLSGTGVITHPGFDDTPFAWNATFQALSLTASFSAATQSIPEPTTGLLFGFGFCLLALAGRR